MKLINYIFAKADQADLWELGVFILCTSLTICVLVFIIERIILFIKKNFIQDAV
jgi:hypothetical protein